MKSTTKLTVKEAVALFVWRNPNCRGYEIQAAYFKNRFGRLPKTKEERSLGGSLTSCACGGGLAVDSTHNGINGGRHGDSILLKHFHGQRYRWEGKRTPPTFTLTDLGLKYVQRALAKLYRHPGRAS